jgi:carbon monoxide dehydrogenase subunit G
MARYHLRIRTSWPADEAFAFMADLTNFAEWDPGVASSVQVTGDGPAVGAAYDVEASGTTLRYEVDAYDPPQRIRARARNRWITSVDTISVAADGTGSIVTYEADLTLNGLLRIGDPLLKVAFNRIGDKAADGLRQRLDGTRLD